VKKKRRWNEKEIVILKENASLPDKKIATMLNRSVPSIRQRRLQLGLNKKYASSYSVNMNFFKKWTSDMAYILGFIYADGNIRSRESGMELFIKSKDKEILLSMNEAMESNYPIKKLITDSSYIYCLGIYRKHIVEDLLTLGITPRKALTMNFPKVPIEFSSHFIRGYFDGDGHVSITKDKSLIITFTSGSKEFLEGLDRRLKELSIISTTLSSPKNYSIYVLSILRKSRKSFYNCLYKDAKIYMKRKKDVFNQYLKSYANKVIKCLDCGEITPRTGKNQKRCKECKEVYKRQYKQYKLKKKN